MIAGALENGSLDLWDAEKLRTSSSDSHMSRTTKHTGAIKALQFNNFRHELLATAGAKGELYISDLNNIANPFRLGASAARADDYECIDWNKGEKVPHILATGSSGGFVTVWDVRGKKENLTLNNMGRKAVSAVSWDPTVATRLITATPNDQDPVILVWDLRNSNAPERTLRGHELGVLSLSWCGQDSDLLLSCGKDNRTICWNPHTGQAYGDFSIVTNWTFQTRWNPHNPNLFATASFDGKISVETIQNTNPKSEEKAAAAQAMDSEDFFASAKVQSQDTSFSLPQAPKWLKRPVGASFGFGGKLVRLKTDASTNKSLVEISSFAIDSKIPEAAQKFEDSLTGGDLTSICELKIKSATSEEEKADWQVIETLNAGKSRKKLREYLGFGDEVDDLAAKTGELTVNGDGEKAQTNGTRDDSSFFDTSADGDNFLADLAATKGAKTNEPFHIYSGTESEADKGITAALMLGKFEKALDICLQDGRMSDAFMIAICGGQQCIDKVQAAYLKKKAHGPNYLRLLASIVGKNLWDVVHNADLSNWKEVMATLCTFADESEFSDLCEALGDRLEESMTSSEKGTLRRDASFCYLAGSKLEKVVNIWVQELQEKESAEIQAEDGDSTFSVHAKVLQDFVEKVTVFRKVTNFQDADLKSTEDWKLGPLYSKYTEYADVLAAHGQLAVAERYLDLLPSQYPLAQVAQQRVKRATSKPAAQAAARQPAAAARAAPRAAAPIAPAMSTPAPLSNNVYGPGSAIRTPAAGNPYAPLAQSYAPSAYQAPGVAPQPGSFGQPGPYGAGFQTPQAQAVLPPPPRGTAGTPSSGAPPASKGPGGQWNDTPDNFFKPPSVSRRNTPGPAAVSSPYAPFPNQMSAPAPPPGGGMYGQNKPTPPLPPPPKAGQAPPRISSPLASPAAIERPSSSAASAYAPTQPPSQAPSALATPGVPRGASPYNPPPSAAPASNRYAPAPNAQPTGPGPVSAPPGRGNPYAPAQPSYQAQPAPTPYGQPPQSTPYGQPPQPTPYGQPPQSTSYGQPPHSTPYGQPPQSTPYGQSPMAGQPPQAMQYGQPPQKTPAPPQGPPRGPPPASRPPQAQPPPPQASTPQPSAPPPAARTSTPAASKYRELNGTVDSRQTTNKK